jgi:ABC-type transport system involved in multi-copper enzyme maturation permease subunit
MNGIWLLQILAVVRLEIKKTFFARRSIWVYLLAFAPVVIFFIHSINEPRQRRRLADIAAEHPISSNALSSVQVGASYDQLIEQIGEPYSRNFRQGRRGPGPEHQFGNIRYTDGETDVVLHIFDGKVVRISRSQVDNLPRSQTVFASSFQFYFLRLAVFFGCVGIFVNLFRGEMLDKSLHFYLLTPMRREVILTGKYLAGLLVTVVIFTSSTALQWWAMLRQFDHNVLADFFAGNGWSQFWSYLGVTALACVAYGSIFLTVGLLFRNPIIPAAVVLLWESINPFLPVALKKISVIYYLQSLCPVAASQDSNLPALIKFLISPSQLVTPLFAVVCIIILTFLMLVLAGILARRLEINYSID